MSDAVPPPVAVSGELLVREFLECVAPGLWQDCPEWPGDLFALAAALLEKSGAYAGIGMSIWPPTSRRLPLDAWLSEMRTIGAGWRAELAAALTPPAERDVAAEADPVAAGVGATALEAPMTDGAPAEGPATGRPASTFVSQIVPRWQTILRHAGQEVCQLRLQEQAVLALIELTAITDECLAGAGIEQYVLGNLTPEAVQHEWAQGYFWRKAEDLLIDQRGGHGSSLCERIHPTRLRVLPKSRTPRSGLSLRSLTHHLCLCPPINVLASWHLQACLDSLHEPFCNLLLIPWPFTIQPQQFGEVDLGDDSNGRAPPNAGWFRYEPRDTDIGELIALVEQMVKRAQQEVSRVHVVVFPELALTPRQFDSLARFLVDQNIGLIAGVLETRPRSSTADSGPRPDWPENCVKVQLPTGDIAQTSTERAWQFQQDKHHRWRLDAGQIVRYGIASQLDPECEWWEGIEVDDRKVNFMRLRSWLTTCVLVCEDLARIDPVGRFVRAVAPDLVVALLMDGPQLKERWPAYHATVLADDPGSSVLTLTCQGMVRLSQPRDRIGKEETPIIAMWRDAVSGTTEIPLQKGRQGIVLTIYEHLERDGETPTADGRPHGGGIGFPVFGGVHYV